MEEQHVESGFCPLQAKTSHHKISKKHRLSKFFNGKTPSLDQSRPVAKFTLKTAHGMGDGTARIIRRISIGWLRNMRLESQIVSVGLPALPIARASNCVRRGITTIATRYYCKKQWLTAKWPSQFVHITKRMSNILSVHRERNRALRTVFVRGI